MHEYQRAAREERATASRTMPAWQHEDSRTIPAGSLRAMRQQLAAHPRYQDERDVMRQIMDAPTADPLAPMAGWYRATREHLPAGFGDAAPIILDGAAEGPESEPWAADARPAGAGWITEAAAGSWYAYARREGDRLRAAAYWPAQPATTTASERRRGLPGCYCPIVTYTDGTSRHIRSESGEHRTR